MPVDFFSTVRAVNKSQAYSSNVALCSQKEESGTFHVTIVTLSAIFSFRKGLIMAKMPLKILGSFMMLTALIRIGKPSYE